MEILAIKFFYCRGWLDEMTDVLLGVKLENLSFLEVLIHWDLVWIADTIKLFLPTTSDAGYAGA